MGRSSKNHIRKMYDLMFNFKYIFARQFLVYPYEFYDIYEKGRLIEYLNFFWKDYIESEHLKPDDYSIEFTEENIVDNFFSPYYSNRGNDDFFVFIRVPDVLDINKPAVDCSWHESLGVGYILYFNKMANEVDFYLCESSMKSSMMNASLTGQYVPVYYIVKVIQEQRRNIAVIRTQSSEELNKTFFNSVLFDAKYLKKFKTGNNRNTNKRYSQYDYYWSKIGLLDKINIGLSYNSEESQFENLKVILKEYFIHLIGLLNYSISFSGYYNWAINSKCNLTYSENLFENIGTLKEAVKFLKPYFPKDKTFGKEIEEIDKKTPVNDIITRLCDFARFFGIKLSMQDFERGREFYTDIHSNSDDSLNDNIVDGETQHLIRWLSEDNTYSLKGKFAKSYQKLFNYLFEEYIIFYINENNLEKCNQIRKFVEFLSDESKLSDFEKKKVIYEIRDFHQLENYEKYIDKNITSFVDRLPSMVADKSVSNNSKFDQIRNSFVSLVENINQRKENKRIELDKAFYQCKTIDALMENLKPAIPLLSKELQPKVTSILNSYQNR